VPPCRLVALMYRPGISVGRLRAGSATLEQRNRIPRHRNFRVAENQDRGVGGLWGNMGARCQHPEAAKLYVPLLPDLVSGRHRGPLATQRIHRVADRACSPGLRQHEQQSSLDVLDHHYRICRSRLAVRVRHVHDEVVPLHGTEKRKMQSAISGRLATRKW
jgi:hypothetical protein